MFLMNLENNRKELEKARQCARKGIWTCVILDILAVILCLFAASLRFCKGNVIAGTFLCFMASIDAILGVKNIIWLYKDYRKWQLFKQVSDKYMEVEESYERNTENNGDGA